MYTPQIPVNVSGKDILQDPLSIDYAKRTIWLHGEIDDNLAVTMSASLRYLDNCCNDDIVIFINSPGGSVTSGFVIYDTIKALNSEVKFVAIGMAASMASFLLCCAGTAGKRFAMPNAEIMIHQPLGGAQGQASDIKIVAEHILATKAKLNKLLSEATGNNIEVINRDTDRDCYMTADQALKYGIIDKIIYNFEEDLAC